jgi:hypothetical protein
LINIYGRFRVYAGGDFEAAKALKTWVEPLQNTGNYPPVDKGSCTWIFNFIFSFSLTQMNARQSGK